MIRRALLAACVALLGSCNEVGFEEEAKVDYTRYRTAAVASFRVSSAYPGADPAPEEPQSAFVEDLKRVGGFASVGQDVDDADLWIEVRVTSVVNEQTGSEGCCSVAGFVVSSLLDVECEEAQVWVDVTVDMQATDAKGDVVYTLRDTAGSSRPFQCASSDDLRQAYAEALDDAVDEVALFFLAGFDI